ncbi:hypothetical protein FRB99_000730 [Tulasnella sp. 403]|nr:hypothetical protein FRB99_000730 [Tulasnella sp. 403]
MYSLKLPRATRPVATALFTNALYITLFAFLCLHTPYLLALAVLLYSTIWIVERTYHIIIALAKILLVAFVTYLFLHSLSQYLPPEIPTPGRRDHLWLSRAQLFMLHAVLDS